MPVITIPTRVTSNSSTLIDHIITNNIELDLNSAVIEADIADHFPVSTNRKKCYIETNLSFA